MKGTKPGRRAVAVSDQDIALYLASLGGHWVFVGDPPKAVNVVDNEILGKFQVMQWQEDDETLASVVGRYLLAQNLPRFATPADLQEYVDGLTRSKYPPAATEVAEAARDGGARDAARPLPHP